MVTTVSSATAPNDGRGTLVTSYMESLAIVKRILSLSELHAVGLDLKQADEHVAHKLQSETRRKARGDLEQRDEPAMVFQRRYEDIFLPVLHCGADQLLLWVQRSCRLHSCTAFSYLHHSVQQEAHHHTPHGQHAAQRRCICRGDFFHSTPPEGH